MLTEVNLQALLDERSRMFIDEHASPGLVDRSAVDDGVHSFGT